MNKIVLIAGAGFIFLLSRPVAPVFATSACHSKIYVMNDQAKKEARELRREARKSKRAAYKANSYTGAGSKQDNARINRENYRQRRKMEKASRKENRRKWGTNQNGDVFGVY